MVCLTQKISRLEIGDVGDARHRMGLGTSWCSNRDSALHGSCDSATSKLPTPQRHSHSRSVSTRLAGCGHHSRSIEVANSPPRASLSRWYICAPPGLSPRGLQQRSACCHPELPEHSFKLQVSSEHTAEFTNDFRGPVSEVTGKGVSSCTGFSAVLSLRPDHDPSICRT
jgi:hypothetical protein